MPSGELYLRNYTSPHLTATHCTALHLASPHLTSHSSTLLYALPLTYAPARPPTTQEDFIRWGCSAVGNLSELKSLADLMLKFNVINSDQLPAVRASLAAHAAQRASMLADSASMEERAFALSMMSLEEKAAALAAMTPEAREAMLNAMSPEERAATLAAMAAAEAAKATRRPSMFDEDVEAWEVKAQNESDDPSIPLFLQQHATVHEVEEDRASQSAEVLPPWMTAKADAEAKLAAEAAAEAEAEAATKATKRPSMFEQHVPEAWEVKAQNESDDPSIPLFLQHQGTHELEPDHPSPSAEVLPPWMTAKADAEAKLAAEAAAEAEQDAQRAQQAAALAALGPEELAAALAAMSPEEREAALAAMSPAQREAALAAELEAEIAAQQREEEERKAKASEAVRSYLDGAITDASGSPLRQRTGQSSPTPSSPPSEPGTPHTPSSVASSEPATPSTSFGEHHTIEYHTIPYHTVP